MATSNKPVADRRYNAKLILPDGTEKPTLIVYLPPDLSDEEFDAIGRQIIASLPGVRVLSDVEDEDGRGTTTESMLDAGLLDTDADGVALPLQGSAACEYNGGNCTRSGCATGCQAMRMVRERRAAADAAERNAGVAIPQTGQENDRA